MKSYLEIPRALPSDLGAQAAKTNEDPASIADGNSFRMCGNEERVVFIFEKESAFFRLFSAARSAGSGVLLGFA